jgi:hypothetical protein
MAKMNAKDGYGIGFGTVQPGGQKKGYTDKNTEIERTKTVIANRQAQGLDNSSQLKHYSNLTGRNFYGIGNPAPGLTDDAYKPKPTTPAPTAPTAPPVVPTAPVTPTTPVIPTAPVTTTPAIPTPVTPTTPAAPVASSTPAFDQAAYTKRQTDGVTAIYEQQKQAQLAQFNAERDKALGLINQQKSEVGSQYADKRNQTDVVNAQNVSRLREVMAANGLQASGENVTASVGLQSARQGALGSLNIQQQQTDNDFNRQITDVNDPNRLNAMIAQIEAQRSQSMLDAGNRADDIGYSRGRDAIGDQRYTDETAYGRGRDTKADNQWDKQFDYGKERDAIGDQRYTDETGYNRGRDKVGDERYADETTYDRGRDAVGDERYADETEYDRGRDTIGDGRYEDETKYNRGRDTIGDERYADETKYDRGQDTKQWDYQAGRDEKSDYWTKRNYDAGRYDKAKDNDYRDSRDKVGDAQWDKQFDAGRNDAETDKAWRTYQYNNMSASEKAQMAQNASQFGEEMAWKMYSQEYQGELDRSMSETEIGAYNGNFNQGAGSGPGGPQDYGTEEVGTLSRKYESNGNPATIARTKGDLGGASYGSYQLTTSSGHAQTFANNFGGALKGKKAGTAAFDAAWKAEASKNPKAFASAQHNYIERNHYQPAANKFQATTGISLSKMPKAVKDMIWSIGVQHGAGGAAKIFKNSGAREGMSAASIIKAVYNERMNVNRYFPSSPGSIKNGVLSRFKRELSDALNMLK